jgi:hypothetical protein
VLHPPASRTADAKVIHSTDSGSGVSQGWPPRRRLFEPVPGTPRWAVKAAWATAACVLPSAAWRTALGLGATLGMPQEWRDLQQVPGTGTWHVLTLSALSVTAASLTPGLVYAWGERIPAWTPRLGGKAIPTSLVVTVAGTGGAAVTALSVWAVFNWNTVATAGGQPSTFGYALASVAYAPALLWGPLLLAVTRAYATRRRRPHAPGRHAGRVPLASAR